MQKNMPINLRIINCDTCKIYFHVKCSGTSKELFLQLENDNGKWICFNCVSNVMPFSIIDNNWLFLDINNKSTLIPGPPTPTTTTKLYHKIPTRRNARANLRNFELMSETISSRYFTPSEFLECKFPPNKFSMFYVLCSSFAK